MNRRVSGVLVAYLFAAALGVISPRARADVMLVGETEANPGDAVLFSIVATAGTILTDIQIDPYADKLGPALQFVSLDATSALVQGGSGFCLDNFCSYYYFPNGKTFVEQTVLAHLLLRVSAAAEDLADPETHEVAVDAGISVQGVDLEPRTLTVLSVPEPSTYALMAAGVILLIGIQARRSVGRKPAAGQGESQKRA